MRLQHIEINGFKSFAKKSSLVFNTPVTSVVGPNGSGKSNVVEAFRFVLGEQSMKSMRGKAGADLIFRGSNTSNKLYRASVSITFDNSDKVFAFRLNEEEKEKEGSRTSMDGARHDSAGSKSPILFDTVTFTREIYADGASKYLLNGTEIRLKTMVELLASVNIGTSTHHIISQGEADGILRASTKDRREMLEDALGLKIYHYRIKESESKLSKATLALKEVQSLRRELAPHLNFLKKQVEKLEKSRMIRDELEQQLLTYLSSEKKYIYAEDTRIIAAEQFIKTHKLELEQTLAKLPDVTIDNHDQHSQTISKYKTELEELNISRRNFEQKINRIEGIIYAQNKILSAQKHIQNKEQISFSQLEYRGIINDISFLLDTLKKAQNLDQVKESLNSLSVLVDNLKKKEPIQVEDTSVHVDTSGTKEIALELEDLSKSLKIVLEKELSLKEKLSQAESLREQTLIGARKATEDRYKLIGEINQAESELQILLVNKNIFLERKVNFDTEMKESGFLFGPNFLHKLKNINDDDIVLLDNLQEIKRSIDRLKVRLDEHSGIGGEVLTEYNNTKERDEFLAREVIDIEGSIKNLEGLIIDLKKLLDEKFTNGVQKINEKFGDFFKTMFGGGSAFLTITLEKKRKRKDLSLEIDEDVEEDDSAESEDQIFERGIEVNVSLPTKKVKELNMLSGGERSLVSIALLFAISQVNPPPFLVLDETDAALDESNSRKYGDMIERLSHYSQLIVVTHNRETMSRANMLYGVTLGADGGSKLLSIKFDDAVKVAK